MAAMSIRRIPPYIFLRRCALAYLLVWVLSPPLFYGLQWRVLAMLAMGGWLLLELASSRSVLLRPNALVIGVVAFVFYTVMIEWLVPDAGSINRHFQILIMLFFLLVGESFRRGREDDARFCFWFILLLLPIWAVATLRGLETVGMGAARLVTRSSTEAMELTEQGIGGYSLVYTIVLCLPFLLFFVLHPQSLMRRFEGKWARRIAYGLVLLNLILGLLLVIRAGYMIALLLSSIIVAVVMLVRSRRMKPFILSVCASAMLVIGAGIVLDPTLTSLQVAAAGTKYEVKLRDIQTTLQGGQEMGTVEGRTERYSRSFRLLLENPVVGTLKFDDVGKHSAILDRFAQYGLAWGLLYVWLLTYVSWQALRDRRVPIGLALAFFVASIVFPLLNNVFMSWGVALYLFSRGAFSVIGVPLGRRAVGDMVAPGILSPNA